MFDRALNTILSLSLFLKMALEGSEDLQGAIQTVRLLKMANWQNPSHLRENLLF